MFSFQVEHQSQNSNGSVGHAATTIPGSNAIKSNSSTPSSTPDPTRLIAGASQSGTPNNRGSTPQGLSSAQLNALAGTLPPQLGAPLNSIQSVSSSRNNSITSSSTESPIPASHHSPQQSPAVSTPLARPLSSPAIPDPAIPPQSPSLVPPHSLVSGNLAASNESPIVTTTTPQQSPPNISPSRRSPNDLNGGSSNSHSGSRTQGGTSNGPLMNGASPNSNGPMMGQHLGFPQHLLQQQMIGGLMQGAIPPNIPPHHNHTRIPHMAPAPPFPGYMRPPVPPTTSRPVIPEESPEALLFNKIIGGGPQFPAMNARSFFPQDGSNQNSRMPGMMYHRDGSIDGIKSEPEPILN